MEMEAKVVKHSKLGLDWLGKIVTLDRNLGEGIVVGYSSVTGEPLAYFYSGYFGDRESVLSAINLLFPWLNRFCLFGFFDKRNPMYS